MKFKFKEGAEVTTDDFWYDLFEGGYIKLDEILEDKDHLKALNEALSLLSNFKNQMEEEGILEDN